MVSRGSIWSLKIQTVAQTCQSFWRISLLFYISAVKFRHGIACPYMWPCTFQVSFRAVFSRERTWSQRDIGVHSTKPRGCFLPLQGQNLIFPRTLCRTSWLTFFKMKSLKIHKGTRTLGYSSEVKRIQVNKDSEISVLETGKIAVFLNQTRISKWTFLVLMNNTT